MLNSPSRKFRHRHGWGPPFAHPAGPAPAGPPRILLVGHPNVGKSALFNRLTGQYVTVSNYPGTTVEIASGHCRALGPDVTIVDTPGMYSLMPMTEEERVASDMLFAGKIHAVVHVVDAKNLERMLGLTLQLIEAGLPLILVLNMLDEARELGVRIDLGRLEAALGVPVVATVSTTGEGLPELMRRLREPPRPSPLTLAYGSILEEGLSRIAARLDAAPGSAGVSARARASLLLQGDVREQQRLLRTTGEREAAAILDIVADTRQRLTHSPHYYITLALRLRAAQITAECVTQPATAGRRAQVFLDRLLTRPWTAYPLLALVLYFALYKFVGQFGAGTLVDFLETNVFEKHINPWAVRVTAMLIPWQPLRELVTGEYGLITLGLRYALAIVLPIVTAFFLVFAILEDSGYLPRLALLVDRGFKSLGLTGRAVIPLVLGFGCDTMATLVTRTLETRRERIICTLLLALAIPCSAQLGVILALLAGHRGALLVWAGVCAGMLALAGYLAAQLLPGEPPNFYMEVPPLRLPTLSNVFVKTYSRVVWYVREILPLFLLASVLLWFGQITHVLQLTLRLIRPAVHLIGLPDEASVAFLFGFFRRDYGAAGLYDLQKNGVLSGNQLTVAAITLTLFLPCVAQFFVMLKERGVRTTLWITAGILIVAFTVGFLTHQVLSWSGVRL